MGSIMLAHIAGRKGAHYLRTNTIANVNSMKGHTWHAAKRIFVLIFEGTLRFMFPAEAAAKENNIDNILITRSR